MFGMGFTEILIIAIIAVLFLGPDKLPSTMVEIAKFFRSMKNTLGTMKSTIEEEMHVADIKQEALAYKQELERASHNVSNAANINSHIDNLMDDEPQPETKKASSEPEEVTFKKKKKKKTEEENIDV
ncbi:Sec-independent protein translocase protein TatB [Sulfurimonas marina]|uniref:Sec-independent protein translocase subunit TatB n=1 Tax=Sulfurimonas marina TaxID=2590551 RepID=A0A7M1AW67_9BACT|nr:Sec-independent protein translocase protein TatB [Sulfurimonas marina]QOP40612.1 Sec-independent protein translocase subunit TatB [Sulfurimonas marina]